MIEGRYSKSIRDFHPTTGPTKMKIRDTQTRIDRPRSDGTSKELVPPDP